jgi:cytochrome P450
MTRTDEVAAGAEYAQMVEGFDVLNHEIAQHAYDVTGWARSHCPVAHSSAHGGYWLVTGYAEVRQALSDPSTFSSQFGVGFPHKQSLMMPPIDMDPPLQKEFRRLLNRHLTRAGISKHAAAIHTIAGEVVGAIAERGQADMLAEFAAPFTARVLSNVILNLGDGDPLFTRAREVTAQIAKNEPSQEGDIRGQLEVVVERILERRSASGERRDDIIDALLYGQVEGRPLTRNERVGTMMVLMLGGLSTTSAALTNILRHVSEVPGLEEQLRSEDWTRQELDEFLRFESPVGSLSRTVMKDVVLGSQQLSAGDVVLLHFAAANRDDAMFPEAGVLDLSRQDNPHLAFGLGDHRCIGSNLARMQIEVAMPTLLSQIENIRLDDVVLERETGPGHGWTSMPMTYSRRPS